MHDTNTNVICITWITAQRRGQHGQADTVPHQAGASSPVWIWVTWWLSSTLRQDTRTLPLKPFTIPRLNPQPHFWHYSVRSGHETRHHADA